MTDSTQNDELTRTIALIYGVLENGSPFWVYAAVKPNKYPLMVAAQKDGTLDLYNFDTYGEIIISGEGRSPPDNVTLKVAEIYQTDPSISLKRDGQNDGENA